MADARKAIGIFDSGVGGLTVVKELIRILPREPIVYLGDTARVPYGNKSRETVLKFSTENVLFLLHHEVKLIVVACHTSSSYALDFLRRHFTHPILGVIEPGVQMALQVTRNGRIGVIGTTATVSSGAYPRAFAQARAKVKVTQVACPLFVPFVEEGLPEDPVTKALARRYLKPLKESRVDTLILGCTHYPLLKKTIAQVMGPHVTLVDSAHQVAIKTRRVLHELGLAASATDGARPSHRAQARPFWRFYVTDEPENFKRHGLRFLGSRLGNVSRVNVSS